METRKFFELFGKDFCDGALYGLQLMLRYHNDNIIELPESVLKEITEQIKVANEVSDELFQKRLNAIRNSEI